MTQWYALTRADDRRPWQIVGIADRRGAALDIGGYYAMQAGETSADSDPLLSRLRAETEPDARTLLGDGFDAALDAYRRLPGIPPDADIGGVDGWFDEVLRPSEAAALLGVSKTHVARLMESGTLPPVPLPNAGIRRMDVERYARERRPRGRPGKGA